MSQRDEDQSNFLGTAGAAPGTVVRVFSDDSARRRVVVSEGVSARHRQTETTDMRAGSCFCIQRGGASRHTAVTGPHSVLAC